MSGDPSAVGTYEDYLRLPGLYRRWELERVIQPGRDFHIEEAGKAADGTELFVVYRSEPDADPPTTAATHVSADLNGG